MPLVYVFAASKLEAQPVLVLAARDGASSEGSGALIIEHGGDRFAVIITGMGTRNARGKSRRRLSIVSRIIPDTLGNPLTRLSRHCGIATLSPEGARAVIQPKLAPPAGAGAY
jgi:hypothetical protein